MKQAMYKRYENVIPIGTMHFTNTFGVYVYNPDQIDKYGCDLVVAWHNGQYAYGYHKHMIHYTSNGRAYIRKGSMRIYLDQIVKC